MEAGLGALLCQPLLPLLFATSWSRHFALINFFSYIIQKTLHTPRKMLLTVEAQEWTDWETDFGKVRGQELPQKTSLRRTYRCP